MFESKNSTMLRGNSVLYWLLFVVGTYHIQIFKTFVLQRVALLHPYTQYTIADGWCEWNNVFVSNFWVSHILPEIFNIWSKFLKSWSDHLYNEIEIFVNAHPKIQGNNRIETTNPTCATFYVVHKLTVLVRYHLVKSEAKKKEKKAAWEVASDQNNFKSELQKLTNKKKTVRLLFFYFFCACFPCFHVWMSNGIWKTQCCLMTFLAYTYFILFHKYCIYIYYYLCCEQMTYRTNKRCILP